jgi:hypothetical protein
MVEVLMVLYSWVVLQPVVEVPHSLCLDLHNHMQGLDYCMVLVVVEVGSLAQGYMHSCAAHIGLLQEQEQQLVA